MKYSTLLIVSLFGLSACQPKEKEEEREGSFEQMVILEEDYSSQGIDGESQEHLKVR